MNAAHAPDVVHDLAELPLPFGDDRFDEIHAYDVMEHVGAQGDWRFFFAQWSDFWRLLKPGGVFCGISPGPASAWAWGDPGHTRIISPECLIFLSQPNYAQVGASPMTDYRFCYAADFEVVHAVLEPTGQFHYVLQVVKPARVGESLNELQIRGASPRPAGSCRGSIRMSRASAESPPEDERRCS
jgi:SAM-dependent methyltransferase